MTENDVLSMSIDMISARQVVCDVMVDSGKGLLMGGGRGGALSVILWYYYILEVTRGELVFLQVPLVVT